MYSTGRPQYIFGRQGRHSGGHFTGVPPPIYISQNPAKDQALAALAALLPVAALF